MTKMIFNKRGLWLALSFVMLAQSAGAAIACLDVFSKPILNQTEAEIAMDPEAGLRSILELDGKGIRDWRTGRKVRKLKLDKDMSSLSVDQLVDSLFKARYGEPNRYRDILKDPEARFKARVWRLMQKEMAANGLRRYFVDREQFLAKDKIIPRIKALLNSNALETFVSVSSIFSVTKGAPLLRMPNLTLLEITKSDMEILLVEGIESPKGDAILKKYMPEGQMDFRYSIARQSFNRIAFVVGLALTTAYIWDDQEKAAIENGDKFFDGINQQAGEIERKASLSRNRDDISIEKYEELAGQKWGRALNTEEIVTVCAKHPAARRCG